MRGFVWWTVAVLLVGTLACGAPEPTDHGGATPEEDIVVEPTADEQVAELEAMCAGAKEAMKERQTAQPLYLRLGGRDGIHAVVEDVVRRHLVNDEIRHLFDGVDDGNLVEQVTDFLAAATGGDEEYAGRDMVTAHEHLGLNNSDFLAAGADLGSAMAAAGVGEDEQQEVLCAFVGLREDVVTR